MCLNRHPGIGQLTGISMLSVSWYRNVTTNPAALSGNTLASFWYHLTDLFRG